MVEIGYVYILECSNGKYYMGSTINLDKRLAEHQSGLGANFTRKNLPVKLVYVESFERIDLAFLREKQVQGWSRKKKEALFSSDINTLHKLSECKNESHANSIYSHNERNEPSLKNNLLS